MKDGIESLPKAASGDFALEFMVMGCNLSREDSFLHGVKRSSQLAFVEPAITELLLIVPSPWNESTDQVNELAADWIGGIEIEQFAGTVFSAIKEIGCQNCSRSLSMERSFHVGQEIELLKARLKLL